MRCHACQFKSQEVVPTDFGEIGVMGEVQDSVALYVINFHPPGMIGIRWVVDTVLAEIGIEVNPVAVTQLQPSH